MKKIQYAIKNNDYKDNQKELCDFLENNQTIGNPEIMGCKDGYFSMCVDSEKYVIYFDVCPGSYEEFVDFKVSKLWELYKKIDKPLEENEEHKFDWILKKIKIKD
jgi:hypothetical protein